MVHKIYLYKKQDHLGNRNKMWRATGKPEATLLTTEYLVYRSQRWNCRMHGDIITSQSWLGCSRNIRISNNSLQTWVKSRRSTSSAKSHNKCSPTWTKQRSSNFARILQNINVLIATLFPKSESFIAVAGEICSTRGVPQHYRRPVAILLQSLALSLWTVEDPNMVLLKDRWCSSRRSRCLRQQDKETWKPSDDTFKVVRTKKDTESHWRSTMLAKRKSCFSIASLLKDTTIQLRKLKGCRTPFFVWMLMGFKSLSDSDQNLPSH